LLKNLVKEYLNILYSKRANEINGRDYIFVNNSQFDNLKLINHFAATTKIGENQLPLISFALLLRVV